MSRTETELPRLASPATIGELSELMARAHAEARTVTVFSGGTAFDDHPPALTPGLLIDLSGIAEVTDHCPDDETLRAGAGVRISALQSRIAPDGLELAADLPTDRVEAGSSLGGMIATDAVGPGSLSRGRLGDSVRSVTVVGADGTIARSAEGLAPALTGRSLSSLMTGSWGTAAILVEAELRLRPMPEASAFVWIPGAEAALGRPVSQVAPAAVEIERPTGSPAATIVLLEGTEARVENGLAHLLEHCPGARQCARPPWWGRRARVPATIRLSAAPAFISTLLATIDRLETAIGYPLQLRGSASGVFDLGVGASGTEPGMAVRVVLEHLRTFGLHHLSARLLRAPASVWSEVDAWGPQPGHRLRRELKDLLDPQHLLSPGRGPGGI